jgi:hypothetical protein
MEDIFFWAYSIEKPGVPTGTPGYKTNPFTFVVIRGVLVICPLAGHSGRLFVYSVRFFIYYNKREQSFLTRQRTVFIGSSMFVSDITNAPCEARVTATIPFQEFDNFFGIWRFTLQILNLPSSNFPKICGFLVYA